MQKILKLKRLCAAAPLREKNFIANKENINFPQRRKSAKLLCDFHPRKVISARIYR